MSASGHPLLTTGFGLFMIIVLCYTAGRLHQWYKTAADREAAFRDGYNMATTSLFSTAARISRATTVPVARGAASVAPAPRHRARVMPITQEEHLPQRWNRRQSA